MKSKSPAGLPARSHIDGLAAVGRYTFTSADARQALKVSPAATKLALLRLSKEGLLASPARGFYVIVPHEYRSLGCLPADQFIPALMQKVGLRYYVGLLSAAQYHGAAHQRPQVFQVMLEKPRRSIHCGQVRVDFFVRKRLRDVPSQSFNTPRGAIVVSTPEATALDLVGYQDRAGGLDQVATLLSELAEPIDPKKLASVAATAPVPWSQRLGYLLSQVGASDKAAELKDHVRKTARETTTLLPSVSSENAPLDAEWKLVVNSKVQSEL